jgi:hypothetical protein
MTEHVEHATAPECRDCDEPCLNGLSTCDRHTAARHKPVEVPESSNPFWVDDALVHRGQPHEHDANCVGHPHAYGYLASAVARYLNELTRQVQPARTDELAAQLRADLAATARCLIAGYPETDSASLRDWAGE